MTYVQDHSGKTKSIWMDAPAPGFSTIAVNLDCDVCVIGGGVTGLTTAYLLQREGLQVVVLEGGALGGGETERTTAHLASALDDRFYLLERLHGREGARLAAESHKAAIDRIEMIVRSESIDCAFRRVDGYLFVPENQPQTILTRELEAARRAGMVDTEIVECAPIVGFHTGPALRFGGQGQVHPLQYLWGLVRAIESAGGRIFTHSHVVHVEGGKDTKAIVTNGRVVKARHIVVATNSPVNDRFAMHTKQEPFRTYVVAARVPKNAIPIALYWDTDHPYHYARLQQEAEHDLLIVGGEDHRTGQAHDHTERYLRLEAYMREHFPAALDVVARWSGQVLEPIDGLAFIGHNPMDEANVYIATGDSGHGMTHGTIAGMLIRDLIFNRPNPWQVLYDPSRKSLSAVASYLRANFNVAGQYADWLKPGEVQSSAEIPAGRGRLMRRGLQMLAVYRDEHGCTHERSAACPHLGGIVQWNDTEKSWDCPCHGSRFDAYGGVIAGPALSDLAAVAPTPNDPNVVIDDEAERRRAPSGMEQARSRLARSGPR
jgi:glycine/D-amino acid oxidase-like deaminating enzyme/nitrite reductase/ring-hydroxylating ferredoxin subunit